MSNRGKAAKNQSALPATRQSQAQGSSTHPSVRASYTEIHTGPLPHPDLLARYNQIIPDGANRILAMAEKQSDHRMDLERKVVNSDILRSYLGLGAGFVFATVGLALSGYGIFNGHSLEGTAIGCVDLAGIVGTFIYGTRSRRQERLEKEKMLTEEESERL